LCWIYHGDRLFPLPNVNRTTLLHPANLYWVPGDAEIVQPTTHPRHPPSNQAGLSFSSQSPPTDYADLQAALRSIQEEQVSLRAYVASENIAFCDFIQERHD